MTSQRILVTKADTAVIECPSCGIRKSISVAHFKGQKHSMRIKCSCAHVFEIELNFRKNYRKDLSLAGTYMASHEKMPHKTNAAQANRANCTIRDLSSGGVGFEVTGRHLIEEGNKLTITFTLDNPKKTVIHRQILVKKIRGNYVGAMFTDISAHETELGFYLML